MKEFSFSLAILVILFAVLLSVSPATETFEDVQISCYGILVQKPIITSLEGK